MAKRLTHAGALRTGPRKKRFERPDPECPGLYLVVQPSGVKSWVVRYRLHGRPVKHTIGRLEHYDLAEARDAARTAQKLAHRGEDPRAVVDSTVGRAVEEYLAKIATTRRSHKEIARLFEVDVLPQWRDRPIAGISRHDCRRLIERVRARAGQSRASKLHSYLRRFFVIAADSGLVPVNPMRELRRPELPPSRERELSDNELRLVWQAAEKTEAPFGPAVRLLILTATRRDEVMSLRWSEVENLAGGEPSILLPGERTKNGRPHLLPLSDAAADLLRKTERLVYLDAKGKRSESEFVFTTKGSSPFSGFSKAKARLDEKIAALAREEAEERGGDPVEVAPWRLHDLRRTAATRMGDLGVLPHVVEAALNHVSGFRAGVAGTYNRSKYAKEKRAALDLWAEHVLAL